MNKLYTETVKDPETGMIRKHYVPMEEAMIRRVDRMTEAIASLAEMLRVTNERMAAMEKVIRTLEKITPQQAGNVNRAIRERAGEICAEYLMGVRITPVVQGVGSVPEAARFEANPEKKKALAAEIRKAVREMTGARSTREIARCDYDTVIAFVMDWDDYDIIQRIRKSAG